jgi:ribosome-interacting GTPase 1
VSFVWLFMALLMFSAFFFHSSLCSLSCVTTKIGTLKAKLAKLRSELFMEQSGGGGGGVGEGFDVARNGDARIALIGFPSVGKSSLLMQLTNTESEAASYEFTTLTCIPGVLRYKGSKIQVLDLPGSTYLLAVQLLASSFDTDDLIH